MVVENEYSTVVNCALCTISQNPVQKLGLRKDVFWLDL